MNEFNKNIDAFVQEFTIFIKVNRSEDNLDHWLKNKIQIIDNLSINKRIETYKYFLNIFEIRMNLTQ